MNDSKSDHSEDFYVEPLTRREQEILQYLAEHLSNNEIAHKLTLAPSSIKWYTKQIFAKLGINSRQQVADRARELGLLKTNPPRLPSAHSLPAALTPFIGRQAQVEHVRHMISESHHRLVTLTGAGGVGKTRLALKVVESLVGSFKDGVWLVELASLNNGALLDQTVAAVFGLIGDPDHPPLSLLEEHLKDKHLLLILDDCEHLIEACARLVNTLLRLCPGLQILVTSRESLGLEGEIPFSVPSMTFPNPLRLPPIDQLNQYEAIHLFVDRAQAVSAIFTLTAENGKNIASICKRLDGIPLAIELAAARVKILSVDQIAAHLEESFGLLAGGFRTALPRHQTMRASIIWSYQMLSDDERVLLRRFSVFSGGWTLEECEAICSDLPLVENSIIDLLSQLVNKSLVVVEQILKQGNRYYLLNAIWEFAHEKLVEAGEEANIRNHHLTYFLMLAQAAEPNLRGGEQIKWLDRLGNDLANLRIALEWSLKTNVESGLKLASALKWFWHIRGRWSEGLDWINRGLAIEGRQDKHQSAKDHPISRIQNSTIKAKALSVAGFLYRVNCQFIPAISLLKESLAFYREKNLSDQSGMAFTLLELASCATSQGDYAQAEIYATESQVIFLDYGNRFGVSECLNVLGLNASDPVHARKMFADSLEIKREIEDINGLAYTLQMLGEITVYETDFEKASAWLEESIDDYSRVGNKKSIINDLHSLSWVAWVTDDYAHALEEIDEALLLGQEIEERILYGINLLMRSDIQLSNGNFEETIRDLEAGIRIGKETGDKTIQAMAHTRQGRLFWIHQQNDQAVKALNTALTQANECGDKDTGAFSLFYSGQAAVDRNDLDYADSCFKKSIQIFYEMNFWYWDYIAYPLEGLARTACLRKDWGNSAQLFGASDHLFHLLINTLSPIEQSWRTNDLEAVKKALGAEQFQSMWQAGFTLTPEQVISFASEDSI